MIGPSSAVVSSQRALWRQMHVLADLTDRFVHQLQTHIRDERREAGHQAEVQFQLAFAAHGDAVDEQNLRQIADTKPHQRVIFVQRFDKAAQFAGGFELVMDIHVQNRLAVAALHLRQAVDAADSGNGLSTMFS